MSNLAVTEATWLNATNQANLGRRAEASHQEPAEAAVARIEAVGPRPGQANVRARRQRNDRAAELPPAPTPTHA